jgi:pimeloyl-ACP methyl ester carboxylesterase
VRIPFVRLPEIVAPESRVVNAAGGRAVGVYEYGDPQGRAVFALHGTPACGAGFDWTDAPARERGLRVIAPDRPGIGHSDPVPMVSVLDYASELRALADALEIDRFALIGYSGGGPYALAVAHEMPDRVEIAEIVAGAGEIGAWAKLKDLSRSDRQLTWLAVHAPVVARGVLRVADIGARTAPKLALRSVATEMTEPDREVMHLLGSNGALALFSQALARSSAGAVTDYALLARPWQLALDAITVPVHCWHGTDDNMVPLAHTEAMLERLPDAHLTTWPDEGHLAVITHVAEVLDDIVDTSATS